MGGGHRGRGGRLRRLHLLALEHLGRQDDAARPASCCTPDCTLPTSTAVAKAAQINRWKIMAISR
jgi:hypothetical protein